MLNLASSLITKELPSELAILGDSMSAYNYADGDSWPERLGRVLNSNGVATNVVTYAINASSFFRINTTAVQGPLTQLDLIIRQNPSVVIVTAGFNDTMEQQDGRTLVQIQEDARLTFDTLRIELPEARIYYGSQLPYDRANFTAATVLNKGIVSAKMTRPTSGIFSGCYTDTMLDTLVSPATRALLAEWEALDIYIRTLDSVTSSFDVDVWYIARLGLLASDGLHFKHQASPLIAASYVKKLRLAGDPMFTAIIDELVPDWSDVDTVFSNFTAPAGTGFLPVQPEPPGSVVVEYMGINMAVAEWFMPYKSSMVFKPITLTAANLPGTLYVWTILGSKPLTTVEFSLNEGAFNPAGATTDFNGNAIDLFSAFAIGLAAGVYTLDFKVGDICYPQITINVI